MTLAPSSTWTRARYAGIDVIERRGDGAELILLHGIGGRGQSFGDLMNAWPGPERVIAWDMPGYGSSTPVSMPTPVARDYADALLRMIDGAGLSRVHVAAQSLGALIGASFARHQASRTLSLTLIAPAQGLGASAAEPMPTKAQERIDALIREGSVAYARARAPRVVFNASHVAAVEREMATLNVAGHTQACHVLARGALAADLEASHAPLAIVTGTEDVITPLAGITSLVENLRHRDIQFTTVPACGHGAYFDAPEAVTQAIRANMERAQ